MYHEVNTINGGDDIETVLENAQPVRNVVKWDDLSMDELTLEIMKIAIVWPSQYDMLHRTFRSHPYPQNLSALERRIRQIFLNLAKGNPDESQTRPVRATDE